MGWWQTAQTTTVRTANIKQCGHTVVEPWPDAEVVDRLSAGLLFTSASLGERGILVVDFCLLTARDSWMESWPIVTPHTWIGTHENHKKENQRITWTSINIALLGLYESGEMVVVLLTSTNPTPKQINAAIVTAIVEIIWYRFIFWRPFDTTSFAPWGPLRYCVTMECKLWNP